ncbi:glutaminyl-peptide cyclotransferase [Candidatus Bathyarchaeota archaeon]|nr:glutaminyl-peptide cyclotransferase [Candidatus Bathyarchaeota archaeon]
MDRRKAISIILIGFLAIYGSRKILDQPEIEPGYNYRVVNKYPHDSDAFTQGLVYYEDRLYEGTGLYGESSLRVTELETGEIIHSINLDSDYFGEGIAILDETLYQLTWKKGVGWIYDLDLNPIGNWILIGEGWGLTSNNTHLIMSNGTSTLSIIDPQTMEITDTVEVTDGAQKIDRINELEYIDGLIYANIWQTNRIAVIEPETGTVVSWIDLKGIVDQLDHQDGIDVLNGIAYDSEAKRIFVTGKLWPNLFEIELVPASTH